ncbi:MAG TPA: penicillin-binding protein activator [Malonomonas sp.]
MKLRIGLILACSLFLLLTTLPSLAASQPDPALVEYTQGRELYLSGDLQHSLGVLRSYVLRYPEHPQIADAYTLIGQIFTRQERYTDALLYLERIPAASRTPQASLLIGYALLQTGKVSVAQQQLLPLLAQPLNQNDRQLLLQALADAAHRLEQPLQALVFLSQQLPGSDNPAAVLERVHQLLQNHLDDADLAEAAFMWQGTAIGQDAKLQLARRALAQQQGAQARQLLQQILASSVTFPYWQEAQQLLQRASVDNWFSRDSIGVLLPLSGRYASYGELVKRGLELALEEHNKVRLPVRFIYRDIGAQTANPAQAVSALTDDDKVMAIIGPLLSDQAEAAAVRAQRELVPLLALSQRAGLPQIGDFIFRDSLTAQQQVETLVAYAKATGHISYSVLHPENRLGEEMTRLFVAEVRRSGGEVLDIVSYPEEGTDFRKQIETLLWQDKVVVPPPKPVAYDQQGNPLPEEKLPELEYPLAPSHALFIPDYADRVGQLVPQLQFYGLKDVTLLGINGWNSAELVRRSGRFLKQAVFVDGFFRDSKTPEVQQFVELYRQKYQEEPTLLEAQGFEAANLLLQVMDNSAVRNRDDFRRELSGLSSTRGVAGTTGFDKTGEAIKQLYLLKVERNQIVELN